MASQRNTVSSGGLKSTGKNGGKGKNPASFGRGTRTDLLSCLPARRVAWAPAVEEDNKTRDSPDLPGLLLHYYPPLLSFSALFDWWLNETGVNLLGESVLRQRRIKDNGQFIIFYMPPLVHSRSCCHLNWGQNSMITMAASMKSIQ